MDKPIPEAVALLEAMQERWCASTAGKDGSRRIATFDTARGMRGEDDFDNEVFATRRCASDLAGAIERIRALAAAQQQGQAAPPSAPVGVEGLYEEVASALAYIRFGDEDAPEWDGQRVRVSLAQQPAAVDEAVAERFCRRWYEITGRSLERAHVLASLDAALATQHQEPTT